MLTGFCDGELILEERAARSRKRRVKGRFPYNKRATLSDGGRTGKPRKEVFAPRAFAYNVAKQDVDIRLLVGHDYGKPLASRGAGTLALRDDDDALTFEAIITEELQNASWVRDFFAGYGAGLIRGLSPGFRIPPKRAVPNAERVDEEDPADGFALIRTIFQALLFELSVVTAAAYIEAALEAEDEEDEERSWTPTGSGLLIPADHGTGLQRTLHRWRA